MPARLRERTTRFTAAPLLPPPPATTMVLEATMICVDNSEWMRNGDYPPSRFKAQADAFAILCAAKTQAKESTAGVLAMAGAGKGVSVLVTLTNDFSKVLSSINGLQIGGEANLIAAIRVAQLALKNRKNKQLQQRIIVFVGSPVKDEKSSLEVLGKTLKKNNVALDVVDFGESDDEKPEKLEALVAAVNSGGNSHIIHIPAGGVLSDEIFSSPILSEDPGSDSAAAASGASSFKFGVDRELALALQISMEEERARQEAAAKKAREESSKTGSEGQSSTSNGDTVMADTEPEANSYTEDEKLLHMDEDEILRQAEEISIEDFRCDEQLEGVTDEATSALQTTFQEEETGTQSDASKVFGNQPFAQSVQPRRPPKKYRRHSKKKPEKKHEKKEDEPEGDKSQ
ncbi:26S proteasome non-ATPase regulatory subunit 4 homolog isoform X1 [Sorghum bicolor]|uniref:26S proteasome non-ATPase regulatory subunit 4 homolog n=1 Tax=Sorghum bicolor TaxID=4558 RepID=C5WP38_SORBI|nr:26S proteasome non-ATPase regulatory subunit 4 homolog isoform X1 [Sorghum bicolor]EER91744.2 hypothetical protein SORBI_3001G268400 [Sorghum bicolor]|eukprot:XP_021318689.1 26S proteasome non-ATPase regulatory subunit 4 homolog isoform X1 [Sorghum bicolor]